MEGVGRELKYYWARYDKLAIEDGILGVRNPVEDGPDTQFCAIVPHAAKQETLELAHFLAAEGHFGVQKTIDKLKQRIHWNHLAKGVDDWCMKCPNCNQHKHTKSNRAPMQPIYMGEPFETVSMDIIGPLPRAERGNRYILTVVDQFTKHVEAYPLNDQWPFRLPAYF